MATQNDKLSFEQPKNELSSIAEEIKKINQLFKIIK